MIKDRIIICDLDSTIIDTSKTIIELNNKINPDKYIEYIPNHDWGFAPMINTKEELSELFMLFDNKQFYDDVIVFPNAIKIINELANTNKVVICSKHSENRKQVTKAWVDKVMPKVELTFVDNFEDKGKLFDNADYCIDDKFECFDNFDSKTICILYGNYQWNKNCDDYHRSINWLEVKHYIEIVEDAIRSIQSKNNIVSRVDALDTRNERR